MTNRERERVCEILSRLTDDHLYLLLRKGSRRTGIPHRLLMEETERRDRLYVKNLNGNRVLAANRKPGTSESLPTHKAKLKRRNWRGL